MENIGEFIINHWILSSLFVILLWLIFSESINRRLSGVHVIDVQQAVNLVNQQKGQFVDIRDKEAFETSHISDALHVPAAEIEQKAGKGKLKNTEQPLVVVCDSGQKARAAAKQFKSKGHTQVFVLGGGLHAWREARLPLFG
ncbi:MAG: rhodanese-like domain-containing protein [Methylophaga sp.]|nr:rhodanese-like domain-containing protein [Methylophaga sp.]